MVRQTLIRQKLDSKTGKPFQTEEIATFSISFREQMKLNRELRELNQIFAGGKMNIRYRLEEQPR